MCVCGCCSSGDASFFSTGCNPFAALFLMIHLEKSSKKGGEEDKGKKRGAF